MTRDELMHRLSRQPDWRATLMILTCVSRTTSGFGAT